MVVHCAVLAVANAHSMQYRHLEHLQSENSEIFYLK